VGIPPSDLAVAVVRPLGPATMGGRITSLAVVEKKPAVQYVGTAGGGVWKTSDNGLNWTPVFEGQPNPSIGAVALAASDPEVVWVGTGEANPRNSVSWGNGVFRSTDGGKTWRAAGLAATHHIGRIIVHPNDPATAWVAALGRVWGPNRERGVFHTTDGGQSWQHVLDTGPDTGCIDLALHPADPRTLFAATWTVRRDEFAAGNPATQFGPKSGLYRSRDGGKTWTRLTRGLPERPLGRCGVAISPRDPLTVYAVVPTDRTNIRATPGQPPRPSGYAETGGIFRSRDGGDTWTKLNDLCPRPFYHGQIRIDPVEEQRIYVLGVALFVSEDGGRTFRSDGARGVHPDHHALWIDPEDPRRLILGGDGGLYQSTTRGLRWDAVHNLPIGQFYGVGLDNRTPYRIYGGLQDNGTWGGPSRTRSPLGITNSDWRRILGFDGFQCQVDPTDPDLIFAEGQYGRLHRIDRRTGKATLIRPHRSNRADPDFRFNWNSPLLLSPHDPQTVYYGGNHLFRSRNRGDTWEMISADLTHGDPGPGPSTGHTLTALAESPLQAGLLYTGSDDGRVCVSRNGGRDWMDVSLRLPGVPAQRWITRIACSPFQAGTAWLSLSRHRQDDRAPWLFRTDDFGANWKLAVGNLPREGPIHVVLPDPRRRDLLYVGTEFGAFVSFDGGKAWQPLGVGLPPVAVHDLTIQPRDREMVLATHGRSLYVLDIAPLQELTEKVRSEPAWLFEVKPAVLREEQREREVLPPRTYSAANPPEGASVVYRLRDRVESARLTIVDSAGKPVAVLPCDPGAGMHRVNWDLRRSGEGGKPGSPVGPGEYRVQLQVGERTLTRALRVTREDQDQKRNS
jgi:photosystem II stability/assembly factor-like uncharacterized protein